MIRRSWKPGLFHFAAAEPDRGRWRLNRGFVLGPRHPSAFDAQPIAADADSAPNGTSACSIRSPLRNVPFWLCRSTRTQRPLRNRSSACVRDTPLCASGRTTSFPGPAADLDGPLGQLDRRAPRHRLR